jgi:hypothetical protein
MLFRVRNAHVSEIFRRKLGASSALFPLYVIGLIPIRFRASDIERLSHGRQDAGPTRGLLMGSAGLRAGDWTFPAWSAMPFVTLLISLWSYSRKVFSCLRMYSPVNFLIPNRQESCRGRSLGACRLTHKRNGFVACLGSPGLGGLTSRFL